MAHSIRSLPITHGLPRVTATTGSPSSATSSSLLTTNQIEQCAKGGTVPLPRNPDNCTGNLLESLGRLQTAAPLTTDGKCLASLVSAQRAYISACCVNPGAAATPTQLSAAIQTAELFCVPTQTTISRLGTSVGTSASDSTAVSMPPSTTLPSTATTEGPAYSPTSDPTGSSPGVDTEFLKITAAATSTAFLKGVMDEVLGDLPRAHYTADLVLKVLFLGASMSLIGPLATAPSLGFIGTEVLLSTEHGQNFKDYFFSQETQDRLAFWMNNRVVVAALAVTYAAYGEGRSAKDALKILLGSTAFSVVASLLGKAVGSCLPRIQPTMVQNLDPHPVVVNLPPNQEPGIPQAWEDYPYDDPMPAPLPAPPPYAPPFPDANPHTVVDMRDGSPPPYELATFALPGQPVNPPGLGVTQESMV